MKKNGQDRHQFGDGKIMIDRKSVPEYLKLVDFTILDENTFTLIDFAKTDKQRFNEIENEEISFKDTSLHASYFENNQRKLILNREY
ncbi:hypothetical protein [Chryseobacterium sp. C3]|uniref:hypothetical protein n=1 Tax=Chryseobacterium sp. C3 TaxID=2761532 RepID=UPI0016257529|nr:hypothetical protein [Chryseobacterium sp. C3]